MTNHLRRLTYLSLLTAALLASAADTTTKTTAKTAAKATLLTPAAKNCPPFGFVGSTNLARNPSFETVGPNGSPTSWQQGGPAMPPSAARDWFMHSSNDGDTVRSRLVATTVPAAGGSRMLYFRAGGNEGGVFQQLHAPAKLMFSAWVYVRRGKVSLAATADSSGPAAFSTKLNQWEQLRVCTDGTVPTGFFSIYNQDPEGGEFFVDRVEIRQTP